MLAQKIQNCEKHTMLTFLGIYLRKKAYNAYKGKAHAFDALFTSMPHPNIAYIG